jgi:hypothetical protein
MAVFTRTYLKNALPSIIHSSFETSSSSFEIGAFRRVKKSSNENVKITLMQNAEIRSKFFMHASMNGDRSFLTMTQTHSLSLTRSEMHFDCFAIYIILERAKLRNVCVHLSN